MQAEKVKLSGDPGAPSLHIYAANDVRHIYFEPMHPSMFSSSIADQHPAHQTAKMRGLGRLLATPSAVGTQSSGLRQVPAALLPPIPLYRRILRSHRKFLEPEMRAMGDQYIKSEFRAHRDIDNPIHIIGFLTEWQMYVQSIEGDNWRGEKMDRTKIDKMSDQQIGQMYELMMSIRREQLGEEAEPPSGVLADQPDEKK